jgi:hypothetical protein
MSNQDATSRPITVEGSTIPDENDLPLTPEQRAFAEVVGRGIARLWSEAHDEMRVCQSGSQDAQSSVSTTAGHLAGRD